MFAAAGIGRQRLPDVCQQLLIFRFMPAGAAERCWLYFADADAPRVISAAILALDTACQARHISYAAFFQRCREALKQMPVEAR